MPQLLQRLKKLDVTPFCHTMKYTHSGLAKYKLLCMSIYPQRSKWKRNTRNKQNMQSKEAKPKFTKGFWKPEEDLMLKKYVEIHGEGNWSAVSNKSGLRRSSKSCRLRWKNYLRPNIKRGMMSEDEKDLIIRLHKLLGNRWSLIAGRLPGRTDNEVKNYWNTHLSKGGSRNQSAHLDFQGKKKHQLLVSSHQANQKHLGNTTLPSEKEGEEGAGLNSWVEDLKNVNHDMDLPSFPTDYSSLYHTDDTFVPILDELVLLEAFGTTVEETMQELIFL